jgi:hypothetical protein
VPVDTPIGYNIICAGLPEMHWVGFEVLNFTVGVKVSGTIYYGTLTLEFYNINFDTCTLITTLYHTVAQLRQVGEYRRATAARLSDRR